VEDSTKFIKAMVPLLEKCDELEKLPDDLQSFMKVLKRFDMREEGLAKVTKAQIYSMDWHSSSAKFLIAAGDLNGNIGISTKNLLQVKLIVSILNISSFNGYFVLGFWDIDQVNDKNQGVQQFKVHGMTVNCLSWDKYDPTRLLSTSYDGFVRCLDLRTNIIDEVNFQSIKM